MGVKKEEQSASLNLGRENVGETGISTMWDMAVGKGREGLLVWAGHCVSLTTGERATSEGT